MKKVLCFIAIAMMGIMAFAQTVTLTFTGRYAANQYARLNIVSIINLTKGWQEDIYWPDTTLTMQNGTGIYESVANGGFGLSQNNPNPFFGTTDVNLTVTDVGVVTLEIVDGNGKIVVGTSHGTSLPYGTHQFRVSLSNAGTYVMTARQNGKTSSIKMVCNGGENGNGIEYAGIVGTHHDTSLQCATPKFHPRGNTNKPFDFGDQMEYVGYATINGTEFVSQHITQVQNGSQTFVLQFIDGLPCPGTHTFTDIDGNVYNTVQIGTQCWMKENLRTTHYANGTSISQGSSISTTTAYWYYPNNDSLNMSTYGLLYNWKAVMRNSSSSSANPSGVQGICPNGWHVPSGAEWTQLLYYVRSQSEYVCGNDNTHIAKALASTTGWENDTATCTVGNSPIDNNATGFSALPAGWSYGSSSCRFYNFGVDVIFQSATYYNYVHTRVLSCHAAYVGESLCDKGEGYSVRCVKDD